MPLETVGQILQSTRDKKKVAISEIALQTNMGRRYLEALETDNYDVFPSQTHILGFIRNYATYLELDPDELIDIYKRTILQESPAPYRELTAPSPTRINPSFVIAVISILLVVALVFMLIKGAATRRNTNLDNQDTSTRTNPPPDQGEDSFVKTYKAGEAYTFTFNGSGMRLLFEKVSNKIVTVMLMNTRYEITEGDKKMWDFDGNYLSELAVTIRKVADDSIEAAISRKAERMTGTATNATPPPTGTNADTIKGNTLMTSAERVEINLTITAKGFSAVNWVKDRNERAGKMLQAGQKLAILATDALQITASTPFNLTLNLNNKTLEINTPRAVIGLVFKWRHHPEDGLYHLEFEQVQ